MEPWKYIAAALVCASACKSEPPKDDGSGAVLARIDGAPITEADLALAAVKAVGKDYVRLLGPEDKKKLLESIVLARAIAVEAEKDLDARARADLERRVRAHKEQLLVEHYLGVHGNLEAVSAEAMQRYYDENSERFGGGVVRRYELLVGSRVPSEAETQKLIAALRGAPARQDWQALAADLQKQGLPLVFQKGEGGESALHVRLQSLIKGLAVGQTSGLTYIEGKPYVARVVAETKRPPKPLTEVREEIRAALAARQKSEALAAMSEKVMAARRVEYSEQMR
jgi:hypothetical protein